MTKERTYELTVIETFLPELDSKPSVKVEAVRKIDAEAHQVFEIDRLLNELNQRFFENKGEIRPFWQTVDIATEDSESEKDRSSRFKRLFSMQYHPESAQGGARLYIKREKLKKQRKGEADDFVGLEISIYHNLGIENRRFSLNVAGWLYFYKKRYADGWDGAPIFLRRMSQGRTLSFSLDSIPPGEKIATALMQNTIEILEGFEAKGYISLQEKEEEEKENE